MKAIHDSKNFPFATAPSLNVDHAPNQGPRMRGLIERCVVHNLGLHLERNGWRVCQIFDGEDTAEVDNMKEAMEVAFDLDETRLTFEKSSLESCPTHSVVLVFGNDGTDCISDWGFSHGDGDEFNAVMEGFDAEAGIRRMLSA